MVRATLALLVLAPLALASSFERLRSHSKRQTLSSGATEQIQGLLGLAEQVLKDAQAGNLTSACTSWAGSLTQCEGSAGASQVALATCACQSSVIEQLNNCASSYGSTGTSAASGFVSFCSNTLPSIAQTGLTSTVGGSTQASSTAANTPGSMISSATLAPTASGASLSSAASSLASALSSVTTSAQATGASTGASGTSGGSRSQQALGGLLGLASLLVFVV